MESEDALRFRNLFYSELSDSLKKKAHHILLSSPQRLSSYPSQNENSFLKDHKSFSPSYLSQLSKTVGFEQIESSKGDLVPTFILLKGTPTEFNDFELFSEIKREGSSLNKIWSERVRKIKFENKKTRAFSYHHLDVIDRSIEDTVEVFSLDNESGEAIAHFINFRTQINNFESNANDSFLLPFLSERISLVLDIMPEMNNVFIMPHSMGAFRALSLVSDAYNAETKPSWYSKLKGIVTLTGAIWGTNPSEIVGNEGYGFDDLLKALDRIGKITKPEVRNDLAKVFPVFTSEAEKAVKAYNKIFFSVRREGYEPDLPANKDVLSIMKFLSTKVFVNKSKSFTHYSSSSFVEKKPQSTLAGQILYMLNFNQHYSNGDFILKVSKTMADFRDKIHQGSEKRRQEWFANHTLPNHIRYISLGATLADPYEYLLKDDKLKGFYNPKSRDYDMQRSISYDTFRIKGERLGDGSTSYHHNLFLPAKHMDLNPKQDYYKAENIALFAVDHLGIAFGKSSKAVKIKNDFPRVEMLKAITKYLN